MRVSVVTRQTTQFFVKVRKTRLPTQLVYNLIEARCEILIIAEKKRLDSRIYKDHHLFFQLKESSDVYAMIEGVYNRRRFH